MLRFALANLLSRPGRTTLSVFGLTIAIAGMVGLFSISGGIDSLIESSLGDLDGLIVLQNGAPIPLFSTLPADWGEEITRIDGVSVVTPEYWARANLIDGQPILAPPRMLLGTDLPSWLRRRQKIFFEAMQEGRFLSSQDVGTNHTVISRQIADAFKKSVGDPVVVNGRSLQVVGIYETGSILLDATIILDISLLREMTHAAPDTVSAFYLESELDADREAVKSRIEQTFRNRPLPPWEPASLLSQNDAQPSGIGGLIGAMINVQQSSQTVETSNDEGVAVDTTGNDSNRTVSPSADTADVEQSPIQVQSVVEWSSQFDELTADLNVVLTLLTGLGVAIAVSSILNTMLMSVTERIVEFGILRANGWSQQDVVRLVICEAALVGVAGGVLGVLFGWLATVVVNSVWTDRIHLYASPLLLVGSLLFAVVVGVLGGFYPAFRAARLSPMDAIRRG